MYSKKYSKKQINDIPTSLYDLDHSYITGVEVVGFVYGIETKILGRQTLYSFKIINEDKSDSIQVDRYAFKKEFENLNAIKNNDEIVVKGVVQFNKYSKDIVINADEILRTKNVITKQSNNHKKFTPRTELHCFTNFSAMEGISDVSEYLDECENADVKTIAFLDRDNVQCFPEVVKYFKKHSDNKTKVVYGCEVNVYPSVRKDKVVYGTLTSDVNDIDINDRRFVGLDIETTGLSSVFDDIIELSVVDNDGKEYSSLCKTNKVVSEKITELTGITNDMVRSEGRNIEEVLINFLDFVKDKIIVAHNATFDIGFVRHKIKQYLKKDVKFVYVDTMNFAKQFFGNEIKRIGLAPVSKKLGVKLENHHRASDDAFACLGIFNEIVKRNIFVEEENIEVKNKITLEARTEKNIKIIESEIIDGVDNVIKENCEVKRGVKVRYSFEVSNNEIKNKIVNNIEGTTIKVVDNYKIKKISLKEIQDNKSNIELLDRKNLLKVCLIVKNQIGLKNLFKIISIANTSGLVDGVATLKWEEINKYKDGLLIGSSCNGGLFDILYREGRESFNNELKNDNYDYCELQPRNSEMYYENSYNLTAKTLYKVCEKKAIKVVATSGCFYCKKDEKKYREMIVGAKGIGGKINALKNETLLDNYFFSTHELAVLFKNMGFDKDELMKLIYTNPDFISDCTSPIKIIHNNLHTPSDDFFKDKGIPSVKDDLIKIVNESVHKKYGETLVPYIQDRLDKELNSIVGNGFAIVYYIAYLLIKKSNKDGYVVGSRGSVGSSFVAYLMGISEVNPLPPHYLCPVCHKIVFKLSKEEKEKYSNDTNIYDDDLNMVDDGFDLKEKECDCCHTKMIKDGHSIPFETFLGFNGDKVPDIDLNFSGEYQDKAHLFCKDLFGANHAFKAGTISTVAEKTAYAIASDYYAERNIKKRKTEIARESEFLLGTKKTTGQHPGGIIIIPKEYSVIDFSPIQYPAGDVNSNWYTTHFDFHSIHDNVLKLDILGHDDPTLLRYFSDYIRNNPDKFSFDKVEDIPLYDEDVKKYLVPDENGVVNSLGIPEFGTQFVSEMLKRTKPNSFSELIKISGLSHGTDVWLNNASDLIAGKFNDEKISFKDVIGCRDDIMVLLIKYGVSFKNAFDIMEFVRHGLPSKEKEQWDKYIEIMKESNVPDWFVWSCQKIKYMFPKAHATAYVISALRIAYFKAHYPALFYAGWFGIRAKSSLDVNVLSMTKLEILSEIDKLNEKEDKSATDEDKILTLSMVLEALKRGIKIVKPDINISKAKDFVVLNDNEILSSFSFVDGIGESTANNIEKERVENGNYASLENVIQRVKLNKNAIKVFQ